MSSDLKVLLILTVINVVLYGLVIFLEKRSEKK